MLIASIYNFKKSQIFSSLILAFCVLHALTDILFGVTAHYGIKNWFLNDIFLFPEWIINSSILIYIFNKKKLALTAFLLCTVALIICQVVKLPGEYWPKHVSSMIITLSSIFVWVHFIKTIGLTSILHLKRFWMLLAVTVLQSISSFILLLYELIPMDKFEFLPSIIIPMFFIVVSLSYSACLKASLCKQV